MNVTANNLANIDTPGFKQDVPIFEGFLVKATKTYFAQGNLEFTGEKFNLALNGPGFFQVETPAGVRYTRNGTFCLSTDGRLQTLEGHAVVGAGVIPAEATELIVQEDGTILVDGAQTGRLELVEFDNPQSLVKEGFNNFAINDPGSAPIAAEETTVSQGFLEQSNVDAVKESVNLIDTVRTYEAFQKVILSFEEADQKSINDVGRLT